MNALQQSEISRRAAVPAQVGENRSERPDFSDIRGGLKDFQRRTVDYVFRRLYRDEAGTRRFLVADEVGLGKTLVARGVIARVIDELWDTQPQITIVYICSNASIARQNIQRLNVTGREDFALASRVTLLPKVLPDLESNRLNFVSFTPATSFDLKSSLGIVEERALLYHLLRKAWGFGINDSVWLYMLAGDATVERFRCAVQSLEDGVVRAPLVDSLVAAFHRGLDDAGKRQGLRDTFAGLLSSAGSGGQLSGEDRKKRALWVGELRTLLARTCLEALRPDLIILDEFQRFKNLLGGPGGEETDLSTLARDMFEYPHARVLLLSATPYKMYTLSHESAEDDHYRDFFQTLRFLHSDNGQTDEVEQLLSSYRNELYGIQTGSLGRLQAMQRQLAGSLRRVMARTERLAEGVAPGCMLREVPPVQTQLEVGDLRGYLALQRVAEELEQPDTLEYWKSAPYLLNFMDDYALQRSFRLALAPEHTSPTGLADALEESEGLLLPWDAVRNYQAIDPGNARLRGLMADTVGKGWWRLLWLPPSLPYYQLGEPFSRAEQAGCTKRLVFSNWRMVPRVIATLLSYEAERHLLPHRKPKPRNTPEDRQKRRPLLRFTPSKGKGRLTGMPALALVYPSSVLAREGNLLKVRPDEGSSEGLPKVGEMVKRVQRRLRPLLSDVISHWATEDRPDEAWYWAAPLLLDLAENPERVGAWLDRPDRAKQWAGGDAPAQSPEHSEGWSEHVDLVRRLTRKEFTLGQPPGSLDRVLAVLAQMAVAGPAVCALRALWRVSGPDADWFSDTLRDAAAPVGWAFLSLFNQPEATALLRGKPRSRARGSDGPTAPKPGGTASPQGKRKAVPYWRQVLRYSVAGCLSAVLDEYAHLLKESLGLGKDVATGVGVAIRQALLVRTSNLGVSEVAVDAKRWKVIEHQMRARFAMRLGEGKDEGGEMTRPDQVRDAFNSPFWPFVLATTSIGQEGLDFHHYCHAVVHWNLPANPVDLEQREGRVHRYKGHAVRKNLASRYGDVGRKAEAVDPWEAMFDAARAARSLGDSDLYPYWVFPLDGGAAIERHVPALPLSRDQQRLEELRRSLAVYRMVFGQNRQEDLLAFLQNRYSGELLDQIVRELRIDLTPPGS